MAGSLRIAADTHRAPRGGTLEIDAYAWCLLSKLPKLLYFHSCAKTTLLFSRFFVLLPTHPPPTPPPLTPPADALQFVCTFLCGASDFQSARRSSIPCRLILIPWPSACNVRCCREVPGHAVLSQAPCSVEHECAAHQKLRRVKQRGGEAWTGEAAAVAMGEAAAVASEEASTEAQQRRQRKWEAGAKRQVVAEVVVFSSEEEEEEISEVTEEEVVAEAQWQWLHGSARKQEDAQEEQQKDVWVELRWNTKKGKIKVHEKRETQKHPSSPMTTNSEYTLFRLAVFVFSSVSFFCFFFFLLTSLLPLYFVCSALFVKFCPRTQPD